MGIHPGDLQRYVGTDGLTDLGREYANGLSPEWRQIVMDAAARRQRGGGMLRSLGRMFGFGGSSSRAAPPPAPLPQSGGYDASVVRKRSSRWKGDVLAGTSRAATAAPSRRRGGKLPAHYDAIMDLLPDYAAGVQVSELQKRAGKAFRIKDYLKADGGLGKTGRSFRNHLDAEDKAKLDEAVAGRQTIHRIGAERFSHARMGDPSA